MTASIWDYFMRTPNAGTTPDATIQGLMNQGAISSTNQQWNDFWQMGHPGEANPYFVDPTQLPQTQYGDITMVRPIDQPSGQAVGGFKLRNPGLQYNDPFYGQITPTGNTIDPSKQRDFYDMIGPLAMSAILGGAGMGLLGPTAAGQGLAVSGAQAGLGALRSGGQNLGGLGGFLGSASGLPFGSMIGSLLGNVAGSAMTPKAPSMPRAQPSTLSPQQQYLLMQALNGG